MAATVAVNAEDGDPRHQGTAVVSTTCHTCANTHTPMHEHVHLVMDT